MSLEDNSNPGEVSICNDRCAQECEGSEHRSHQEEDEQSDDNDQQEHRRDGWQVQINSGWVFYPESAQETIRSAVARGQSSCEVFAQNQYYRLDLTGLKQKNPQTGNERTIRCLGAQHPSPEMPKLNFRRLMAEFRQVEIALRDGQLPIISRCEPVEDNLMEWDVDMSFPSDSPMQRSLDNLAASMFDTSLNRVTLRLRFPVEFPMSPPEVWLRRPRLKHQSGPVTFGGRICTLLLASAGWQPSTSIRIVLSEVQETLVEAGVEANTMVSVKRDYPANPLQLERLRSELYPTVNGFSEDGMIVLSPAEAAPFLGDLARLELTDKICLPLAYANQIYRRAEQGADLVLPMIFEVKTLAGRKTHCAILEFINGLPENHVLMPKWVMEDLVVEEREPVRVRGVDLDLITYVKVQPHSVDFYHAVRASGREVNELLTASLSRFSALTEDTAVPIEIADKTFHVQVIELRPRAAVRIIDTDVEHHFEFKVDFEPAPDLEDEAATKAYQDRVIGALKLRRERSATGRQDLKERRELARQKKFHEILAAARSLAGSDDGASGEVEIALRLPDGSQTKGKFREGACVAALSALALSSSWAETHLPWGVYLHQSFPKKVLKEDDVITKQFHRSAVSVLEEQAPERDDELLAVLSRSAHGKLMAPVSEASPDPEIFQNPPLPERNEVELLARTERAFEVQRFIRAGYSLEEAAERYDAGEILPPNVQHSASRSPRSPPAAHSIPAAMLERSLSEEEERQNRIQDVINFTGVEYDVARQALEDAQWVTDAAVNSVLDNLGA